MSDFKLYELNGMLYELLEAASIHADLNDGEIPDGLSDEIDKLNIARDIKVLDVARYYKTLNAKMKAIKNEIDTLHKRANGLSNQASKLKDYLNRQIQKGEKFEDSNTRISWRKSKSIVIDDESVIPGEYFKITKTPILSAIKTAIASGEDVDGAHIEERNNLQIK